MDVRACERVRQRGRRARGGRANSGGWISVPCPRQKLGRIFIFGLLGGGAKALFRGRPTRETCRHWRLGGSRCPVRERTRSRGFKREAGARGGAERSRGSRTPPRPPPSVFFSLSLSRSLRGGVVWFFASARARGTTAQGRRRGGTHHDGRLLLPSRACWRGAPAEPGGRWRAGTARVEKVVTPRSVGCRTSASVSQSSLTLVPSSRGRRVRQEVYVTRVRCC